MSSDVTLRAIISGSSTGAVKAFEETGVAADAAAKKSQAAMDSSTSKIGGFFDKLGQKMGSFGIPFSGSVSKIGTEMDKAGGGVAGLTAKFTQLGKVATIAGVAGLAAVGAESTKLAEDQNKAAAQYDVAAKNNGESAKTYTGELNRNTAAGQANGFNQTAVTSAATVNVRVTKDQATQTKLLNTEMDVARAKNISLTDAANLVTKAYQGNAKGLKSLGINIDVGSDKAKTLATDQKNLATANLGLLSTQDQVNSGTLTGAKAQDALRAAHLKVDASQQQLTKDQKAGGSTLDAIDQKVHGAAKAYGETLGGQLDIAKASVTNLGIKFGEVLIPMITKAIKVVTDIVTWLTKHKVIAEALGAVIGGILATAIAVYIIGMGTKFVKATGDAISSVGKAGKAIGDLVGKIAGLGRAQTVQAEESTAAGEETQLSFEGMGTAATETGTTMEEAGTAGGEGMSAMLGPIGLVLIVAMLVVTHWQLCKKLLDDVWRDIKGAVKDCWDWVKDHLSTIIPIIVTVVTGPLGLLVLEIVKHWNTIRSDVSKLISDVVGFFTALPGEIVTGLGDIVGTIWGALKNSVQWIDSNVIAPLITYVTGIPARFVTGLGDIVTTIWHALTTSQQWIETNVTTPLVSYFTGIPGKLLAGLGDIVGTVFGGLSGAWTWIKTNVYDPIVSGFGKLPGDIGSAISGAASAVGGVFSGIGTTIVNGIISAINSGIIDPIDSTVASISFLGWHAPSKLIPEIPHLATGGPLAAGQTAWVGEKGMELFTPSTSGTITPNNQLGGAMGGESTTNNVEVNVASQADPYQIAAEVGWALRVAAV
jgi:hypothetical protein